MAGLVSETIRGSGIREALTFASACGAICTTAVGAGTALKNRKQVLELVGAQKE
jgi:sugar/nucleoside kinase (ribokinase family)